MTDREKISVPLSSSAAFDVRLIDDIVVGLEALNPCYNSMSMLKLCSPN